MASRFFKLNLLSRPHAGSVAHFWGGGAWLIKLVRCVSGFIHLRAAAVPLGTSKAAPGWLVGSELTCARCHHSTRHIEGYWSSFKSAAFGFAACNHRVLTQARAKVAGPIKKKKVRLRPSDVSLFRLYSLFTASAGRLPVIGSMPLFGICVAAVSSRRVPETKVGSGILLGFALIRAPSRRLSSQQRLKLRHLTGSLNACVRWISINLVFCG